MAGTPKKRERRERLAVLLTADETLTMLCERISGGETLATVCTSLDVPFTKVRAWLYEDDARAEAYEKALQSRDKAHEDRVIDSMMDLIDCDPSEAFNDDGSLRPLSEIPSSLRRWIVGLEVQEIRNGQGESVGHVKKLRFGDKVRMLEVAARRLKMLTDRYEVEAKQPSLAELLGGDEPEPRTVKALPSGEAENT